MYFNRFPKINFRNRNMVDISRRLVILDKYKNRSSMFQTYIVAEGEKIEDVAYKVYGSPLYHWVIIFMNNIVDPFYDWVLSTKELNLYIADNYPGTGNVSNAPDGIHHWLLNGRMSFTQSVGAVSISNKQFEIDENEKKRTIKLLRNEYITQAEDELNTKINE